MGGMSDAPRRPGLDRFRTLEAEGGIPFDDQAPLPVAPAGELPFRRCASCGMDAHRAARTCEMCGADLRTPEQERFNRELQRERRAGDEAFAREAADLARSQAEAAGEQRRLRAGALGPLGLPGGGAPSFEHDPLAELFQPGGGRRAAGRLAFTLLLRGLRAIPAVVFIALAGLLLVSVAYAKATGNFGHRQFLLTGLLLVPLVVGILVGRPLRRPEGGGPRGVPPGRSSS